MTRARRGPRIPEGTVRISKSGADISIPFEVLGEALEQPDYNFHTDTKVTLRPLVDEKKKRLRFVVVPTDQASDVDAFNCRPYVTSQDSRSVVVTCRTLLEKMGKVLPGRDYPVKVAGDALTISFGKVAPRKKA